MCNTTMESMEEHSDDIEDRMADQEEKLGGMENIIESEKMQEQIELGKYKVSWLDMRMTN